MRSITLSVIGVLLTASLAHAMGGDHPSGAVSASNWPAGLVELVTAPSRVHGYWFNDADVFFFRGDTAGLNQFLGSCAASPARVFLTLHSGRLEVKSPWDTGVRDVSGNWTLSHSGGQLSTLGPDVPVGRDVIQLDV